MASLPNLAAMLRNRQTISSRASSQVMRWKALLRLCGAATLACPAERLLRPFRSNPPHRIQHAVRRVHAIQILRDLRAQKPARHRMRRITLNLGRAAVVDRDQDTASVRTIMRTGGVDNFFHDV